MTTKRYEFTGETKEDCGVTLKQIRRLINGEIGGWIKDEDCLPQGGEGWVYSSAMIYGGTIYGGDVHGGEVHGGTIYGGEMWRGEMWGGKMYGGEIDGGKMYGGEIQGGTLRGGEIHGGEIQGGTIRGGEIYGGIIRGGTMRGGAIFGGTILRGMIVTRDPIFIILPMHNITVADNMAAVGCEVHDFSHWREYIEEIGKKHGYSEADIALYKGMLFLAMDRMEAKNAEDAQKKGQKKNA